ncbi:MAG: hypothetical protein JST01_22870 [Cyanobacteria bacterium SZAS TMP-1]|nr:hypothetical protein [Cyanobacteria bacterium SZAS TMP-1]
MRRGPKKFSKWVRWDKRHELEGLEYPGIYALLISSKDVTGQAFSFEKNIVYFGMTNSRGGLRSRLRQFERTIGGKTGHGGAMRFRAKHKDRDKLAKKLFVSISYTVCNVWETPEDLLLMGEIAKQEYECQAKYMKKFNNQLPEFNDKELSPKF